MVLPRLSWRWWSCIYDMICVRGRLRSYLRLTVHLGETAGTAGRHLHISVMKNHVAPESLYTWQRAAAPAPMLGRPEWRAGAFASFITASAVMNEAKESAVRLAAGRGGGGGLSRVCRCCKTTSLQELCQKTRWTTETSSSEGLQVNWICAIFTLQL